MSLLISSFIPFPPLAWWAATSDAAHLKLDAAEHFEKMTWRNRYCIAAANGPVLLSVPLLHGREQRKSMANIKIDNKTKWQLQHWRTIVSAYKRTPYFDHYEPSLDHIFSQDFNILIDFNLATLQWLHQQLKPGFEISTVNEYQQNYEGAPFDLRRNLKNNTGNKELNFPRYYQLFSDRNGFVPNLSILDLLFSEGPHTMAWIKKNRTELLNWL